MGIQEFQAIHDEAQPFLKIAMELSLVTLQSRSECCNLKLSDRRDGWIYVIRDKTAGDSDMAFIRIRETPEIAGIFNRALNDDIHSPYFVHFKPQSNRPQHLANKPHWTYVNPSYLTKAFKTARNASGVYDHLEPRQRPSFHEIRSLGARQYQKAGFSKEYIRGLMTHTDIKVTEIYLDDPGKLTDSHFLEVEAGLSMNEMLGMG